VELLASNIHSFLSFFPVGGEPTAVRVPADAPAMKKFKCHIFGLWIQ